jgi:hypothetical protein
MGPARGNDPEFLNSEPADSHFRSYGFARYETTEQAEDCIHGLVSLKYEAGFARVCNQQASFLLLADNFARNLLMPASRH